jgi:hypothetical protein
LGEVAEDGDGDERPGSSEELFKGDVDSKTDVCYMEHWWTSVSAEELFILNHQNSPGKVVASRTKRRITQ